MAWIESHQSLERHPKTLCLMSLMGWDLDITIGKLHRFWWWCVDYAENGSLKKYNDEAIGLAVGLNGEDAKKFVNAMCKAGFIDRLPDKLQVHGWLEKVKRYLISKYHTSDAKGLKKLLKKIGNPKDIPKDDPPTNQPNLPNQPLSANAEEAVKDKVPLESIQKVIKAYKIAIGVAKDDKAWDKAYFKRYSKPAKELILFFDGDVDEVIDCIEGIQKWAEAKRIDWTLETVVKRAGDWKIKRLWK